MAARKTINVEYVIVSANKALATVAPSNTPDFRLGVAMSLEHILLATGNYHGFGYLTDPKYVKRDANPCSMADATEIDGKPTDFTRRHYFFR